MGSACRPSLVGAYMYVTQRRIGHSLFVLSNCEPIIDQANSLSCVLCWLSDSHFHFRTNARAPAENRRKRCHIHCKIPRSCFLRCFVSIFNV